MNLKEYRKYLNFSQSKMGEKLGVSNVTYGQWETGKRRMSATTILRFVETFDCIVTIKRGGEISFDLEKKL